MAISADIIINLVFIEVVNYLQSEYRIKFYGKVWQYGNLHIDGLRFRYGYHHLYVGVSRKRGRLGSLATPVNSGWDESPPLKSTETAYAEVSADSGR